MIRGSDNGVGENMTAHWLDRDWRYIPASSHADSSAFRRRQRERKRVVAAQAAEATAKVAVIVKKKATA